ncbi:Bulb-type lectin domain containing protein [Parasponia andersonii]|uniref:Bulb-type lectin domain containing protein n=1 Tax=Parasponia andersonii TaxID=3476 RepID=A0A2P5BW33_PARAD|nr:Bulb-type lectin domain containing protein [Parasponia andersonii]
MRVYFLLCCSSQLLCCLIFLTRASFAVDSLRPLESIKDGGTLVSPDGSFELGFFSPGSAKNRYLGIWYKNIPVQTVVRVANRCNPITNSTSGLLTLNGSGNLVLLGQKKTVVWSSTTTTTTTKRSLIKQPQKPILQLLDSGNPAIGDEKE